MKAKRAIGTTVTLCLTWMTACGDGAAPGNTPRESIRDERYCEFATLFFGDEGITSTGYTYRFKGECSSGKESRMFEGNGDNDGTDEEKTQRCYEACKNKKALE